MMTATSVDRGLGEVARRVYRLSVEQWGEARPTELVGRSPAFEAVQSKLPKIASFCEPVLIAGESGVGKELLAQAIYLLGPRRGQPYVVVNCPQYQEGNLTVSELFGHRRGSFTGAVGDRRGCFETADGGVIFLDEIADLHMSAQVMLLRALASSEFQPLGAARSLRVNVRVVAATNRPLDRLMIGDAFRHDLFFRLRYFLIDMPPLRRRGEDWRLLLDHFLARLHGTYGVRKTFSAESLKLLEPYPWPGNVRQLLSVATTGYALSEGDRIEPGDFSELLAEPTEPASTRIDDLYRRLVAEGACFWDEVYVPFLDRDLNRAQVRAVIRRGLGEAQWSYRRLLERFGMPPDDYQKFMDFLRHHRLKP